MGPESGAAKPRSLRTSSMRGTGPTFRMENTSPAFRRSESRSRVRIRRSIGCAALLIGALSIGVFSSPASGERIATHSPMRVTVARQIVGFRSSQRIQPLGISRFSATPTRLTAEGGNVRLDAVVSGAEACRFTSTNPRLSRTLPCSSGLRQVVVHIPKNSSTSSRSFRFMLVVVDAGATRKKSVSVAEMGQGKIAALGSAPVITLEPSSETVSAGALVTLQAAASGSPTPSVQWQISSDGGVTWQPFAGATSAPYSFRAATSNNGDEFEAVFTNSVGSATTSAATLTVEAAPVDSTGGGPVVTTQPTDETTLENTTAAFFAAASGSPTSTVQWEVSIDSGASWQPVEGATSTCYSFTASSSASGEELEAVFTNSAGSTTTNAATLTVDTGPEASANWSGYVATDPCAEFDSVSGSWTVPPVACSSGNEYSSEWVGIDGDTSQTVEQDGTESDCEDGVPTYDAWYEMFGDQSVDGGDEVPLSTALYPVSPGDEINASVSESNGTWTLALSDPTDPIRSWTFSIRVDFASASQSSAEWIVERPEICYSSSPSSCELTALADFGDVTFSNAQAATSSGTPSSIPAFSSTELNMENNADSMLLDESGSLDPSGEDFTVTWNSPGP